MALHIRYLDPQSIPRRIPGRKIVLFLIHVVNSSAFLSIPFRASAPNVFRVGFREYTVFPQ